MRPSGVSGVFAVFQVCFPNLTQPDATGYAGFCGSVSGVSGFPRAQAYTHYLR